ncbi:PGC-1 and ERR-induced regulator in muscle protein 1 [Talpa occidentalis]|uniref:PGC-1 and ERR-induced regulator in muscle protein 1 n=1 Tax=Talpa occidentalis TaxID=50954 RepID=UPI00188FA894|nr:PGC-1 and ERR-induced regulator in muscle protein 1 [Talpa occidentalis]
MENFQYSIQLSDQDWAEFAAAAEECDLLQASLASGDEPLSSDIDQGDSSGSSPPGPPLPLKGQQAPQGRGWPGCTAGEKVAPRRPVSRSWPEPALAPGAGQQTPGTSPQSEARLPLGSGQSSCSPGTAPTEMQRLLQGPAPQGAAPGPPGQAPRSPPAAGCSAAPQKPPSSPGTPTRSPSRKKRRAVGAKGGSRASAPTPPGSPTVLAEARPEWGAGPGVPRTQDPLVGTAMWTAGAGQDGLRPDSASAPEEPSRQGPGWGLSTPAPQPEPGTDLRTTPRAEPHVVPTPAQETGLDISVAKADTVLPPPASQPPQDSALSTPAAQTPPDSSVSRPASQTPSNSALPTPFSQHLPDSSVSTSASQRLPDSILSTPTSQPLRDSALSTPAAKPLSDSALSTPPSQTPPDSSVSILASQHPPDSSVSTPASQPPPNSSVPTPATKPPPDLALSTLAAQTPPDSGLSMLASQRPLDSSVSTLASKSLPDSALSTPASQPPHDSSVSTPASKPLPDSALSTPASKLPPDSALSTPTSQPPPTSSVSTPASSPPPDSALSTSTAQTPADSALSTSTAQTPADSALSTPASQPLPDSTLSTPASQPRLNAHLPTPGPVAMPELGPPALVPKGSPRQAQPSLLPGVRPDVGVSAPASRCGAEVGAAPVAQLGLSPGESPGVHQDGETPGGPVRAPKKKKVRFSMAMPGPEGLCVGEASNLPPGSRVAPGSPGGPGAWDAVAVGPRSPQPRILKHLPPLAPSASVLAGAGSRSSFAVTLPEAYEFFFCDTIEEEDEGAEEAGQAAVQWPDMCEYFFRDCRTRAPGGPAHAEPVPAPPTGDPMPITIPEAYEHFLGEDGPEGSPGPATLLRLQALGAPGPGSLPEPGPASAEQLDLVVRRAGDPPNPLGSLSLSQNDMCLVFVAFATWAVRTSDLHAPDAWKTVLLANIGTISAIRYFRRQVGRGRRSRSPSP